MNDELFDLLVSLGVIVVSDLEYLAKIRAYIAKLQQQIADAEAATALAMQQAEASAAEVAVQTEKAVAAQVLADQALEAQLAAEAAFAADQAADAQLSAGLAEIVAAIPEEVVPVV